MTEYLPNIHKALDLNSSTGRKKKKELTFTLNEQTRESQGLSSPSQGDKGPPHGLDTRHNKPPTVGESISSRNTSWASGDTLVSISTAPWSEDWENHQNFLVGKSSQSCGGHIDVTTTKSLLHPQIILEDFQQTRSS